MWWWAGRSVAMLLCLVFAFFGINLLIGAYGLESPYNFVLTFFASNLIILISLAILVGCCFQIHQRVHTRGVKPPNKNDAPDSHQNFE